MFLRGVFVVDNTLRAEGDIAAISQDTRVPRSAGA
jgi:hypothetical protein